MYSNLPYYHYTQKKKHVKHAADIFTTLGTFFEHGSFLLSSQEN